MEFEHAVGGPVDAVHVASNYFFVGFEACPIISPDARAGMVHGWNLDKANDPPSELWMNGTHAKYAGSGRVRCICTREDGRIWTGGNDGMIREWTYVPPHVVAGGGGGSGSGGEFALVRGMGGHLGAVTGLALSNGVLWSGGMDGTIRLWNVETGEHAHAIPALGKDAAKNGGGGGIMGGGPSSSSTATIATSGLTTGAGHSGPITGLLPFELPGVDDGGGGASSSMSFVFTSSLDETVRVWNATNGECVASERHGQGVTAIALSSDLRGNPLLLCGLFYGDIMIRGTVSNPPLCLLLKISHNYLGVGHEMGPVNDIQPGPGNTFYAVADDGKLTAWQITGDFGL
jgi:WD40 repeat protein